MPRMKTHHVVPNRNGGWDVKKGGAGYVIKNFNTKKEAEKFARQISRKERTELVIHGLDGKIQRKDSHGHDPRRTKG